MSGAQRTSSGVARGNAMQAQESWVQAMREDILRTVQQNMEENIKKKIDSAIKEVEQRWEKTLKNMNTELEDLRELKRRMEEGMQVMGGGPAKKGQSAKRKTSSQSESPDKRPAQSLLDPDASTSAAATSPGDPVSATPTPTPVTKRAKKKINIFEAAKRGDQDAVKENLDSGVGPNSTDDEGNTPLHIAAQTSHKDIMDLLLDKGAKLLARNNQKKTALHLAASGLRGRTCVSRLLKRAEKENNKCLRDLINGQDVFQNTALHYAAMGNNDKVVKRILKYKPDASLMNSEGKTPLEVTEDDGVRESISEYLSRFKSVSSSDSSPAQDEVSTNIEEGEDSENKDINDYEENSE